MIGVEPKNDTCSAASAGSRMCGFLEELYPICRSITGDGLRETLRRIGARIPLEVHEVPSGTQAFDWTVPREWNVRDAYVKNAKGERVIDFQASNLHLVNYSVPVRTRLPLRELKKHLHTLPAHPGWIPYRTSYYRDSWGFCLSQNQLDSLPEGEYEVVIDSSLENGSLTYAECVVRGETADEVLISTHCCHPSLCNDNLSGIAVATFLAQELMSKPRRLTYRFLFIPGTIGSITWLSRNEDVVPRIRHGLVLACVGDRGDFSYKKTRLGNAQMDRAMLHVLSGSGRKYSVREFSPYGYDERQYCSPGFNLPVGCLNRTPHGCFAEYHTSADNLDFVSAEALEETMRLCVELFELLDNDAKYVNVNPRCEPQLGRRGLYRELGGYPDAEERELAMLWVLNFSDGSHSLLDIAERANLKFSLISQVAAELSRHGLLAPYRKEGQE